MYYMSDYCPNAEFGIRDTILRFAPKPKSLSELAKEIDSDGLETALNVVKGELPSRPQVVSGLKKFTKNPVRGVKQAWLRDRTTLEAIKKGTARKVNRETIVNDAKTKTQQFGEYLASRPEWVNTLEANVPGIAASSIVTAKLGTPPSTATLVDMGGLMVGRQVSRDVSATMKELKGMSGNWQRNLPEAMRRAGEKRRMNPKKQVLDFYEDMGGSLIANNLGRLNPISTPVGRGILPAAYLNPALKKNMTGVTMGDKTLKQGISDTLKAYGEQNKALTIGRGNKREQLVRDRFRSYMNNKIDPLTVNDLINK